MKLLRLETIEQTSEYIIFNIDVEIKKPFRKAYTETWKCAREIRFTQSFRMDNCESLFRYMLNIDKSINSILSTKPRVENIIFTI